MIIPPEVLKLLKEIKFCSLATSYQDQPHVSLMNFTYLPEEGVVILSSRPDTTKVHHIKNNPAAALLLFSPGGEGESPLSCTLYGTAALAEGEKESFYRKAHYQKNHDMSQFILKENVIITIDIKQASLTDLEDRVRTWSEGHPEEKEGEGNG